MADEKIETTAEEAAPKKKKQVKKLPIIIAAVCAITVLGVAGWAWHETPECCDMICHSTMGKYYDTFVNDTSTLVYKHKASSEGKCVSCHEATLGFMMNDIRAQLSGDYTDPLYKATFSNEFCLQSGCHSAAGFMPGASTSSTADWSFDPHSTQHGVQQCNSCHHMHDQSVFTCAGCHTWGGDEEWSKTPDGWVEYTLDDGSVTAAPEGWAIPTTFEAAKNG